MTPSSPVLTGYVETTCTIVDARTYENINQNTHEGRLALVTGAAQGIGQAIALALAERGAQVIATDLEPPHETVNKIGPTAYAFQLRQFLSDECSIRGSQSNPATFSFLLNTKFLRHFESQSAKLTETPQV